MDCIPLYYITCIVHCICIVYFYIMSCIVMCIVGTHTHTGRVGILSHWLDYVCTMYCIVLCVLCICIVLYCVLCIVLYFVLWEDTGRQGGHIEPLAGPRLPPICLCLSCRSDFFPFLCFCSLSLSLSELQIKHIFFSLIFFSCRAVPVSPGSYSISLQLPILSFFSSYSSAHICQIKFERKKSVENHAHHHKSNRHGCFL